MEKMIIDMLRTQAYWMKVIADRLENGEPVEDYLWTIDDDFRSLIEDRLKNKEDEAA